MPERWIDDGHTVTLEVRPGDDCVSVTTVTCPGEGPCEAGFVVCDEWEGPCSNGRLIDEDGDETEEFCPSCDGTGKQGGKFQCWLAGPDGQSNGMSWTETLNEHSDLQALEPGTYRLLVSTDGGSPDEFHCGMKLGAPITANEGADDVA